MTIELLHNRLDKYEQIFKRTLIALFLVAYGVVSYKYGHKRGQIKAFEFIMNNVSRSSPEESSSKSDGEPGSFTPDKEI